MKNKMRFVSYLVNLLYDFLQMLLYFKDASTDHHRGIHRMNCKRTKPSWMENVNLTNELIFKYQVITTDCDDILQDDLKFLRGKDQVFINIFVSGIICFLKCK